MVLVLTIFLDLILVVLFILFFKIDDTESLLKLLAYAIAVTWIPYAWIKLEIRKFGKDLIKYKIAKNNGWIYDPRELDGSKLVKSFKNFTNGRNKIMEDRFWGNFDYGFNKHSYFHRGNYGCRVGYGKSARDLKFNYCIVSLPKSFKSEFVVD